MKCETCQKEFNAEEQIPGQYKKICFACWEKGDFQSSNPVLQIWIKRQWNAYNACREKYRTMKETSTE